MIEPSTIRGQPDFRTLFESAPGSYLALTPALVIVAASDAYLQVTMTRREKILGRHLFNVFPDNPGDATATGVSNLRASLTRVLQHRIPDAMAVQRYDLRRPDTEGGEFEERYWSPINTPVFSPNGEIAYIIHRVEDITERKRAEETVRQSEEHFRLLVASVKDYAILMLDPDGHVVSWNAGAERIKGYQAGEIIGQHFSRFYSSGDIHSGKPELELKVAATEGRFEEEGWRVRKDGTRFWANVIITAIRDETGTLRGFAKVTRDITERKRAEEEFRKSEEKYRTLFDSVDEGVCTIEVLFDRNEKPIDYRFLEVNPSFEKQTGIHNAQGRRMREIAPLHEEHWFEMYGKIALTGEPVRFENQAAQLGRWYEVYALRVGEPKERHVAILFKDITERKRAEEALRRVHDQLEMRVQERTAEILAKTRDLETLLYVTSHDLREPLRGIENFSRMVHDRYGDRLDDKGRDFLQRVVRGTQRMDQLMTDILTLSRVQRMEGAVEDIQGESIVTEALRRLDHTIKETGATVRVVEPLPRWQGNRTWATQGIYNLIANALKFRRNGEAPDVEIAPYHPTVEDGSVVGIVVRDRGPGVAPEHAERIFQLFQRAVGREIEGTGAGLAIVRQVAERHGGRAWVQSREGGGSEFKLTFSATNRQKGSDPHDESAS
ncbi:MAG TPA: PAS domain S-box protein [Nitrospiraceae bacterium]|nr:PAS domain S-box protein [Nitrospiraceae bacterium]